MTLIWRRIRRNFLAHAGVVAFVALAMSVRSTGLAQTYVGDDKCEACHQGHFDDYMQSGHPFKLNKVENGVPPVWPETAPPPVPDTLGNSWENVSYVIGNYFWKARFVQNDGFIHTGDAVQYNLATGEWVGYHAGETKPYNCGRCHTTGYDDTPDTHQDGLPGITGTWAQPGVRCEACHGPGSDHEANPATRTPGGKACDECHYRDSQFRMPWKGGFMRHHQQGEDLAHSPHAGLVSCEDCHDPHKSVVYPDAISGEVNAKACSDCHPGNAGNNNYTVRGMENIDCIDCHMPDMGKSAVAENAFKGDVRGHIFRIMTDPVAAIDNTYQADGTTFWKQDAGGQSSITLDYACLGCHEDRGPSLTLQRAAAFAKGVHSRGDTWNVRVPYLAGEFTVEFEDFAGVLFVETTRSPGVTDFGIGIESNRIIFWMDITGAIYFGNIDRGAGTMRGIVFDYYGGGSSIFFAEQL